MSLLALAALAVGVVAFVPVCSGGAEAVEGVDQGGARDSALVPEHDDGQGGDGAANDPEKEAWEEELERHEERRTIVVGIFLGIVLLILVLWWGWGKVYRRPRKL